VNPYTLPPGNVQIAFSGGRTSAYMLHHILEANGGLPDRARVVFANTGREMPETLDFVQEVGQRWGVPIAWVQYSEIKPWFETVSHNSAARDGEPFEAMIRHKRYTPNGRKRICTEQLKVRSARRMLVAQGWKAWSKALGIRADEPQRHDQPDQPRETIWLPLVDAHVRRSDVLSFWRSQPFDLAPVAISNCRLCFQFDRMKLGRQMLADPSDNWPERMEAIGHGTFIDGMPWVRLREQLMAQPDMLTDVVQHPRHRSCGAAMDGECTG
jgi:Phosphoadenosine phosphosulfate reductase family